MKIDQLYRDILSYLFSQFPQYQSIGAGAYKPGLDGMIVMDRLLGHPHHHFRSIHVAGTNGKGSVSHLLAAILQQSGYRVGLYTSPHLVDFRERIRINGTIIPKEEVIGFVSSHRKSFNTLRPSFFEITTAMAFRFFKDQKVDIAVIETGLGGRLDSTNIINPILSVITNIGLDHCEYLGDTLPLIAAEKAGVIKSGVPVVIGERHLETDMVFVQRAEEVGAPFFFAEDVFVVEKVTQEDYYQRFDISGEVYLSDLMGAYQQKNIPTVLMATQALGKMGLHLKEVKRGIRDAARTTGLRGRWECISQNPKTIVDVAHNEHGMRWAMDQLKKERYRQLHFVFGVVKEKDIDSIIPLLPADALYYFTQAQIKRALGSQALADCCQKRGLRGKAFDNVSDALSTAVVSADRDDLIFVGGSIFVAAEVFEYLGLN
ncbi:MAG: bifunctional folylpolyglutamate synthase/dihydrofolate synthase [Prevotellaceae bacterium]|jgi:dihydrofolate synthase/folylpolyglutamate synthase|nr:bifunctional folylpolyglutamate synthase/dihydrofolate synthase [Prevotellaceae bacterium]